MMIPAFRSTTPQPVTTPHNFIQPKISQDLSYFASPLKQLTLPDYDPDFNVRPSAYHFIDGLEVHEFTKPSVFMHHLKEMKDTHKFGSSVYLRPENEYEGTRMFLTQDRKSGFIIAPDGEMGSVFSKSDAPRDTAKKMVQLAKSQGALKAKGFDTVLPDFYTRLGFRAVSRIPWESIPNKPTGWDSDLYKKFNNGKPDRVYMVLDEEKILGDKALYSRDIKPHMPYSASQEDALSIQTQMVERVKHHSSEKIA